MKVEVLLAKDTLNEQELPGEWPVMCREVGINYRSKHPYLVMTFDEFEQLRESMEPFYKEWEASKGRRSRSVLVQYEFDFNLQEDKRDMKNLVLSQEAVSVLWDLDQEIRSKLKYGADAWLETGASDFLDELRKIIWDSGMINDQ